MKANSPIILEISSIFHSIKSSSNSQSIHILNDNNLLLKTLTIQAKKFLRNQPFRFSEQDFIADSIEQGRVAGAPDAGTGLTESIGFEILLKPKNKPTENESNQLPILFGEKNDKQDNDLPSITISLATLVIKKNPEEIISLKSTIQSSPNSQGVEQEISLDQYFVESNIKQTSKYSNLISPLAVPIYNNALASTGEVLPYGVQAVWGGLDISRQGNSGANSHVFVIDSGVLDTTNDLNLNTEWSKSWISGESAFTDGAGHGTHVAGTIAALANGRGVVGVAPGSKVTSLKVFDSNGRGASYSTIIDAVIYATQIINDNELDKTKVVINMSLGGIYNKSLDAAIRNAADQGIVFAIAAGNSGHDADLYSPASAGDHQNVYTISAVDNQYQMPSWSNWDDQINGDDVSYAAPGVNIFSYYKGGQLAYLSGTSMAAPHVAGLLLMGGVKEGDMVLANSSGESDPFALIQSSYAINYITISTVGSVALQRDSGTGLYAVTEEGGKAIPITIDNAQIYEGIYVGWQAVAAATINNNNTIAWKHISGNISIWNADDNWSYLDTPFSGYLKGLEALQWEAAFNQDFNGDNAIGLSFSDAPLSSNGGINLGLIAQAGFGYGIQVGAGELTPISFAGGYAGINNPGAGWLAIGITPTASGSTLYWRNSTNNTYASWDLNAAGALVTGRGLSAAELYQAEVGLGFDITGDLAVGLSFSDAPISSNGGINLGLIAQAGFGYGIQVGAGELTPISFAGGFAGPSNPGAGWQAIAAGRSDVNLELYWQNRSTFAKWDLTSDGQLISGELLSGSSLAFAEQQLGLNLNGDAQTGFTFSAPISISPTATLGFTQFGYGIELTTGEIVPVTYGNDLDASPLSPGAGWEAIAAAAGESSLELFWRNGSTIAKWDLDLTGQLISGELLTGSSLAVEEQQLGIDLNQDTLTGFSFNSLSVSSTADLGETQFGYGIQLAPDNIIPITYGNGIDASPLSPGAGWNAVAAATSGSNFDVYWKNGETYAKWTINAEGALIPGGRSLLDASLIPQEELLIGADINGNERSAIDPTI
ncbi:peptidase family S8 protein [Synechococcus sp. SYN20]|uniref:S8 family serine peptidase n=1 Tax=Synechococcus sp. SYN20 TaxID=1050714 RepID=UPI00164910F3|nr:S8 family serine peptidase [Synechococcus sp. SYN20]QNJ25125.1 peptidase family S8 protein [Synechococcus sp. SYN20]